MSKMDSPFEDKTESIPHKKWAKVPVKWNLNEMIELVNQKYVAEHDNLHSNKWYRVSNRLKGLQIVRSGNQCRKKWESLVSDYKKIKEWESKCQSNSFWSMSTHEKKRNHLPTLMEPQVFDILDTQFKEEEGKLLESTHDGSMVPVDTMNSHGMKTRSKSPKPKSGNRSLGSAVENQLKMHDAFYSESDPELERSVRPKKRKKILRGESSNRQRYQSRNAQEQSSARQKKQNLTSSEEESSIGDEDHTSLHYESDVGLDHVVRWEKRKGSSFQKDYVENRIGTAIQENLEHVKVNLLKAACARQQSDELEKEISEKGLKVNNELQSKLDEYHRDLRRKQGDNLIQALGTLVNALNNTIEALQNDSSQC